jgi:hypothetical protein
MLERHVNVLFLLFAIKLSSDFLTDLGFRFMVLNATLNNISVISWGSDFLMEEAGV